MKVVALCAGKGTRLGVSDINKSMILLQNRPLLEYSLNNLSEIDEVDEFIIVIGFAGEQIKNHFQQNYRGRKITYITQTTLNGIVGAIELTREAIKDDDFIVWLGDEYMHTPDLKGFVSKFRAQQYYCLLGAVKEERIDLIKKTYSLSFDHENHIEQLIEKPQNPVNNYRGTGCVLFRNEIFQYINDIPNNNIRNERDYVDLIQAPIHDNKVVAWYEITDKYINVNDQEDLEFLFSTWNK